MNPNIDIHNSITGEMITREMTDEEYAELLAGGWLAEGNTPEEWQPES
jgi:hypothetical protein